MSATAEGSSVMAGGMSARTVEVLSPGLLTTVQDLGRWGYASQGLTQGGALDQRAYRIGCIMLGEEPGSPALEFVQVGPTLRFGCDARVCLTGGDFDARLDGRPVGRNRSLAVRAGQTLAIGRCRMGNVGYLCVAGGGFAVEPVMGSASTAPRCHLGGWQGRPLVKGDVLPLAENVPAASAVPPALEGLAFSSRLEGYGYGPGPLRIRAMLGPHAGMFDEASRAAFFESTFIVTRQGDRMGVRLDGPRLRARTGTTDIVSEGMVAGAVQVSGAGLPMVMLADHQVTGGYAVLAVVATADLPRLAQARPGTELRFELIDVAEAQRLMRAMHDEERRLLSTVRLLAGEKGR